MKGIEGMRVAICDDNLIFLDELNLKLQRQKCISEVCIYSSPLELTMTINDGEKFDLIFMDIDWGSDEKQNGLQWGEEICKILPEVSIIFVTGYNDRFAQHVLLTDANILGYMTKPVDDKVLERYLKKADEKNVEPKYLVLSRQGGKVSVAMDEIIHIESHNHQAYVFTENDEYVVYEKLADIQKRLLNHFIQCHKSYIVNMNWVSTYEGKTFMMRNGKEIPISRTYMSKVREAFFRFLGEGI